MPLEILDSFGIRSKYVIRDGTSADLSQGCLSPNIRGFAKDIVSRPRACMVGGGAYPSHKNFMAARNVPYLALGGDCYDKREFNAQRVKKDVELFMSTIIKKSPPR